MVLVALVRIAEVSLPGHEWLFPAVHGPLLRFGTTTGLAGRLQSDWDRPGGGYYEQPAVRPSNAYDAKGMMISAIRDDNPVIYMFHEGLQGLGRMWNVPGATTPLP
jgi:hypothetical protein